MQSNDSIDQLDHLLSEARRNEATWKRFHQLQLELMACESLPSLFELLGAETARLLGCEFIHLQLLDPGFILRRLLEESGFNAEPESQQTHLSFCEQKHPFNQHFAEHQLPILGNYEAKRHCGLFPGTIAPRSVALLPLIRGGVLIGSLNLGSLSTEKFHPADATDFLQHFSAIIAVCLESMEGRERLKHLGLKDPLTGINNRRFFDQRLHEEVSRARREQTSLCALFIDIDHFKAVNDQHGHKMGDIVLQQVASTIREQLRTTDTLARYGGEEFAALLSADIQTAVEIAERIRIRVSQQSTPCLESEQPIHVSISAGVACLTDLCSETNASELSRQLLHHADTALYRAKSMGRNRTIIFQPG